MKRSSDGRRKARTLDEDELSGGSKLSFLFLMVLMILFR
jgi:hypothetical protein